METYNPKPLYFGWSANQLRSIERMEEAVRHGAMYAWAEPRGNGKTTRCRMLILWAVSYAYRRYPFLLGANAEKAEDSLSSIKTIIRFLPEYADDFPEIVYPVARLGGIAHRAQGQICCGVSTQIEWSKDRIVLPTVPPPPNWPARWPLRSDGMVPSSGVVIATSGLTGDGIRGSLLTLKTGEMIRPDIVVLDDPQTAESARSASQNATRENLVGADVLGMAGPGRAIAAVMPCTIIERGDMADRILNRKIHPVWRGERTKMLESMPTDLAAWERYFEVYRSCILREPPDQQAANDYYVDHREELEAGAVASWAERKNPEDISAIQHAMHLFFRDRKAFFSEYQNEPMEVDYGGSELDVEEIKNRLNKIARGTVPRDHTRLTAFIDVQGKILYYAVCSWDERFGGAVVDYGTFPKQNRAYFAASDARPTLADSFPGLSEAAAIYAGLKALTENLLSRAWKTEQGVEMRIDRCLIDSGWNTDTIYQFCRQCAFAGVIYPSKGYGIGAAKVPISEWPVKPGERSGYAWRLSAPESGRGRTVKIDVNLWKSFIRERLATPEGSPGCLMLCGSQPHEHQLLADHLTSEYRTVTEGRGRRVEEWNVKPTNTENHWWDCVVGCAVAASITGLKWIAGEGEKPKAEKKRKSLRDVYEQAKEHAR